MSTTAISQGPWTRIRPLQRDEIDPYTEAGITEGEITWGRFPNNLGKVMAYLPRMAQTEVEYCNTFIFDPPTFRGEVQEAGFLDRCLKELVISRASLCNRSRYSVFHHAFIGWRVWEAAGRSEEAHDKYLYLHEHEKHPEAYTPLERAVLDYTVELCQDAHRVTDEEFAELRRLLREHNLDDERLSHYSDEQMARHVDSQIVELTWLVGHFCLLNLWFTALQVPNETADDELDFLSAYTQVVPEDIRRRNDQVMGVDF